MAEEIEMKIRRTNNKRLPWRASKGKGTRKKEIVRKKEKRTVSSSTSVFLTLKMKTKKDVFGKMRKLMAM